ncbi:MAG: hypothetical protein ACFFDT_27320 [Candidatus Hodarchaeota archaeon]
MPSDWNFSYYSHSLSILWNESKPQNGQFHYLLCWTTNGYWSALLREYFLSNDVSDYNRLWNDYFPVSLDKIRYTSLKEMIREDSLMVIFGSFPVLVVFAFIDFQAFPDFFMFLPYISVGCSKFLENLLAYFTTCIENHHQEIYGLKRLNSNQLYTLMILGLAISVVFTAELMAYRVRDRYDDRYTLTLAYQQEHAAEILDKYGDNVSLLCLGKTELFVTLNRTNPSRFLFLFMGIDNYDTENRSIYP